MIRSDGFKPLAYDVSAVAMFERCLKYKQYQKTNVQFQFFVTITTAAEQRERERGGVSAREMCSCSIKRRGGAGRRLNGGRNGPSPNSSPSHTHSTNHCRGSTAPSHNSSGFPKVKFAIPIITDLAVKEVRNIKIQSAKYKFECTKLI